MSILESVRQKIFDDVKIKSIKGMKVNIDADIALKFLELSLNDVPEDGLDVRYLLSCQKKRKEEIMEGIEKRYKTKL